MFNLQKARELGLVVAGILAGACLFAIPKYASSASREGDAVQGAIIYEPARPEITFQQNNPEGWGGMQRVPAELSRGPVRVASRLYPRNDDCAAVKLDVWVDRGLLTYMAFNDPSVGIQAINTADQPGRSTLLIGGKDCQVRVTIERADGRGGSN
jgi:hypothetical protein